MTSLNPTGASPETKVVASSAYGSVTLVITWILTNYVFHGHIPADLQNLLPGFVAMTAASVAGWLSQHTPRLEETVSVVRRELAAQMAAQQLTAAERRPPAPQRPAFATGPVPQAPPPPAPQAAAGPTGMAQ